MPARMRATLFTWVPWSASTHATRRAGPGPQDDMFLSFFYSEIFLYRHPDAGRDPLRHRHLCRIRDDIIYLDPGVKPQDDMFLSSFHFVIVFRKKEKCVTPVLDTGAQVIRVLCVSTDNLLSLRVKRSNPVNYAVAPRHNIYAFYFQLSGIWA